MSADFDFKMPEEGGSQRKAFRARVPGLEAWLSKQKKTLPIADLSAGGLALMDPDGILREGEIVEFDLLLSKKLFLSKVRAQVMRKLPNGTAGCNFDTLDRQQEALLDKLVLEVQKRLIALKRAQAEQVNK